MLKRFFCLLLICLVCLESSACLAASRDEIRNAYRLVTERYSATSPYETQPDPGKFAPGNLTEEARSEALAYLNFLRWIAGLEPVALNEIYNLRSQNAALVLAANDELTHQPAQPAGMPDELYESALLGASQSNIARFNWMQPQILIDGIEYFARDDGAFNLSRLGHRRWLLNPCMAETGFGLANAKTGISYTAMYAVDDGNAGAQWDRVCWPAEGHFPAELMRSDIPWSVSLNDELYNAAASKPVILMTEQSSGAEFRFDIATGKADGFCTMSSEAYGCGSCLIFRPDLAEKGIPEYEQNQVWDVWIGGLMMVDGSFSEISYRVEMISLYPQDVANVELSRIEAELATGESLQLRADVVPSYADDTGIQWSSSDTGVADVDASGMVRAIAPGTCEITASSANGRSDTCRVTVK